MVNAKYFNTLSLLVVILYGGQPNVLYVGLSMERIMKIARKIENIELYNSALAHNLPVTIVKWDILPSTNVSVIV